MKQFLGLLTLLMVQGSWAQIDVFECSTYVEGLTQTELYDTDEHYGSCIEFDGNIDVSDTLDKLVQASNSIHIIDNFHAGGFNDPGGMHLKIEAKSELNVVAMEYEDLYAVQRYKKLELGVELPVDLLTRIDHYLHDEGTYPDELNPFLEWDVDVKAYFYNADPGWYEVVDGFYYREYVNDTTLNDWVDVGTTYPFRIRYAPPRNGNWTCKVEIKIDSVLAYSSGTFGFNVVESGDPGYVYVHPNQKNLMRGDRIVYPVGQNFVGPEDEGIPWGINNPLFSKETTYKACRPNQWQKFRDHVGDYISEGGNFIRLLQNPWSMLLEFEKKGNYYDRLHYAWEQDRLMELCEDNDVLVMYNLLLQEPFMENGDYGYWMWDWNRWVKNSEGTAYVYNSGDPWPVYCYNDNPQPSGGKRAHEMFLLEDDLKYHEQRMRYYIARYGYSTSIYEFELLSEPFHLNQHWSDLPNAPREPYFDVSTEVAEDFRDTIFHAIENYHGRMAWYVKEKLKHWQQLIGVNYSYYLEEWNYDNDSKIDKSYHHGNIDIIGVNFYDNTHRKYIPEKNINDDLASEDYNNTFPSGEQSFARMAHNFQNWSGKPVIISESDHGVSDIGGTIHDCSGTVGNRIDVMSMGFTGVCGFNLWVGKNENEKDVWPTTIRGQQHMNGDDVINTFSEGYGDWIQGRQLAALHGSGKARKELQYYVSQNGEYAAGYIRNRTYNIHTKRFNDSCYVDLDVVHQMDFLMDISWDDGYNDGLLWVTGLKNNHDYQIDWYSFVPDGWYLESDCQNTNGDKFKLKYPELITTFYDRPIVWFVMKVQNCQSGMVVSDNTTQQDADHPIGERIQENALETDEFGELGVKVYPNPFEDEITIVVNEEDKANVYTLDGQLVMNITLNVGKNTINTKGLAKGMYLIQLKNYQKQFKLVRQ